MKRASRWRRSPGWPLQGLGTAALLMLFGLGLWGAAWLVGHGVDDVRAWIGGVR